MAVNGEFRIGGLVLVPHRELRAGGEAVNLGRTALEILSVLATARGALVTKDELMEAVWPGRIVEDNALQAQIVGLRKTLGEAASHLSTVRGLGYRLDAADGAKPPLRSEDGASIAVLPFAAPPDDAALALLADGIVEETTRALARFKTLFVIASSSGLSLRSAVPTPVEAARLLGVRYLLCGSVRKAGDRLRISAELIDAAGCGQIWADRFDGEIGEVFALQDRIALRAAGAIGPAVLQAEIGKARARPAPDPTAYELWLRAMPLYHRKEREAVTEALVLLHRAIAHDPQFGAAMGTAVACHMHRLTYGWSDDPDYDQAQAEALSERALLVTLDDPHVLSAAAFVAVHLERELDTALALLDRALALNPCSSFVWMSSGTIRLYAAGEIDLAADQLEHALRLDPLGPGRPNTLLRLAAARFLQRHYEEAVTLAREGLERSDELNGWVTLAASLGRLGRHAAARGALARFSAHSPIDLDEHLRRTFRQKVHRAQYLEGIALADGRSAGGAG